MSATMEPRRLDMRPWYRAALDRRVPWPDDTLLYDDAGMRRQNAQRLLFAVPNFAEYLKAEARVIPADYTVDLDEGRCVSCPCGRRPVLGLGEMRTCARARAWLPTAAGCDRVFLASRTVTFVIGGPKS